MKIYTCAPKPFKGGEAFFKRDTGLICRGFQSLGHTSKAILLGPKRMDDPEDDLGDVMRAELSSLTDVLWWKSLDIDACIFCSWGKSEYQEMANAIVAAGIKLIQITDTQGILSPRSGWFDYMSIESSHYYDYPVWKRRFRQLTRVIYGITLGGLLRDRPRVKMLTTGAYFAAATPVAKNRFERLASHYAKGLNKDHFQCVAFPISLHGVCVTESDIVDKVVAVGRWDDKQKRQQLLMSTVQMTLEKRPDTVFEIYGFLTQELKEWHKQLRSGDMERVRLIGVVPHEVVMNGLKTARTLLCPSAYEGCCNASAEALTVGCSVVAVDSPAMSALKWHASLRSGTLSPTSSGQDMTNSLCSELALWDTGERSACDIAKTWQPVFNFEKIAETYVSLIKRK